MFSCLGPDTLRELRGLYTALGWPPPGHEFTDMHDWGDMLVHSGFAEPVMDMERITLAFDTPERLLQELRELGANLHPARFPALRGRHWRQELERALDQHLRGPDGQLALTFEVIYGHALKPLPRAKVSERRARLSLAGQAMRADADKRSAQAWTRNWPRRSDRTPWIPACAGTTVRLEKWPNQDRYNARLILVRPPCRISYSALPSSRARPSTGSWDAIAR